MEVTPTTSGLSLLMPPANQVSVGTDSLIRNKGSVAFTVKANDGSTIISVPNGEARYVYVTNNSTVAGTWGIINFGYGTSAADAATLAGYGMLAITSTLNQSHPTSSIVNGYTFVTGDRAQTKIWSGGSGTVNLPSAVSLADNWFFLLKNNGTGSITVACNGSEKIDLSTTKIFAPNESAFIVCTGSQFVTVGYGQSSTFVFNALVKPVTTGNVYITPSEAANTIQEYVGSLSGNVISYYPPAVNLYVVSNQTTDNGYSLTLSTGVSGGANAIIPPGQQATLICDGTNFLNANTVQAGATSLSLVNGSVGTPALNFAAETSSGLYRPGAGQVAISILGTQVFDVISTGVNITGSGNFTTGISGGIFS
jgi:hypothetical protein